MFTKFVAFWIEHSKLTWLFIIATLTIGVFSRFMIPKQYNPDIVVPAFQVVVPAPGFSSQQSAQLLTKPLENILMGLEGVDHVYGYSAPNMSSVMVAFRVGVNKEVATTRLTNALTSYQPKAPFGSQAPIVQSIDSDDIPVFSFTVYYSGTKQDLSTIQTQLRTIGLELIDQLKTVPDTTIWLYQGGQSDQIRVDLDLDAIVSRQLDISQILMMIQSQQTTAPVGSIKVGDSEAIVTIKGSQDTLDQVKHLVVADYHGQQVILSDVAQVTWGSSHYMPSVQYTTGGVTHEAISIGVAKKKGTNVVFSTTKVQEQLSTIASHLPSGYHVAVIQNEGKVAAHTTNMLLFNLAHSILLVIIVLGLSLGTSRALNVAISIPLTLSLVFLFSLVTGDNINRITLFALILVLGMLVDDAIVVVENISRHLEEREHTGKTIKQAIVESISEVELAVALSTLTRLLSFVAMFFVSGMMGDYMGPIPKYAIVTLSASMVIALSINPFLARVFEERSATRTPTQPNKITILIARGFDYINIQWERFGAGYREIMMNYLDPQAGTKRSRFKMIFWIILAASVILPISFEIFRARMLPKSDQAQVYLWVDAGIDANVDTSKKIANDIQQFLLSYSHTAVGTGVESEMKIIDTTTRRIATAPMLDFSNLFRGSQSRMTPRHISVRINLTDQSLREISSEEFIIAIRPVLQKYLAQHYPGVESRLLEDPPGPPTRATFLLELTSNEIPYDVLIEDTKKLYLALKPTMDAYEVKDMGVSDEGGQMSYTIQLDQQLITRLGLSTQQVVMTLGSLFHGADLALMYDDIHREPVTIHVQGNEQQLGQTNALDRIMLTNPQGKRVPLIEIATIVPGQQDPVIYSDDRFQTVYIYGEMGSNSVIYPMIGLYKLLKDPAILGTSYQYEGSDFYGIDLIHKATGQHLRINFGGEWELTMDTFRDMGLAFIAAFIAIYIMMVIQFGGFSLAGTTMIAFLLGFFGIFPGYALLYIIGGEYFSATSMIGVIALAGIAVGNAIILLEYVVILLERGNTVKMALVHAGWVRLRPILITSLTAVLGATTILEDPVRSGVAWAIILGLTASALLTTIVLPIFMYESLDEMYADYDNIHGRISHQ